MTYDATSITFDEIAKPTPSFANAAVAHCCKAWKKAFRAAINDDLPDYKAATRAGETYRATMPPLSTCDGCLDFIACVAQGILLGAISEKESSKLLYAAQVALTASNNEQKSRNVPVSSGPSAKRSAKSKEERSQIQ